MNSTSLNVRFLFYGLRFESMDWSPIGYLIREGFKNTILDFHEDDDPFRSMLLKSLQRTIVGLTPIEFTLPMPFLENGTFISKPGKYGVAIDMTVIAQHDDLYLLRILEQSVVSLYGHTETCRDYVLDVVEDNLEDFEFTVFIPVNYVTTANIPAASLN